MEYVLEEYVTVTRGIQVKIALRLIVLQQSTITQQMVHVGKHVRQRLIKTSTREPVCHAAVNVTNASVNLRSAAHVTRQLINHKYFIMVYATVNAPRGLSKSATYAITATLPQRNVLHAPSKQQTAHPVR